MACFHPVEAWQLESGKVVFVERGKVRRCLTLPCGRCIGCRQKRVRNWAQRCVHEAQMNKENSFITLTYDEKNFEPSLNYRDFQKFMYRLRRRLGPTRFYMCGEYGDTTQRPHFHALLFGRSFRDGQPIGKDLFFSQELTDLWGLGFASFGEVTPQSAAYVARYTLKKRTGKQAIEHYERVHLLTGEIVNLQPEFGHMSLKPGIGYSWFKKYWEDCYKARDGIVGAGGRVTAPSRYYDKLLETEDIDRSEELEYSRYLRSLEFSEDCTVERLKVREDCSIAREKLRSRSL